MDQQLIKAAQDGNDAMVASILGQNPGLINAKSSYQGNTALISAAMNGRESTVATLLRLGGNRLDVNIRNNWGDTALIYAAFHGHISTVMTLLRLGGDRVDLNIQDNRGKTAMDSADNESIRQLLRGHPQAVRARKLEAELARRKAEAEAEAKAVAEAEMARRKAEAELVDADRRFDYARVAAMLSNSKNTHSQPGNLLNLLPNYFANINQALRDEVPKPYHPEERTSAQSTLVANALISLIDGDVLGAQGANTALCILCKRLRGRVLSDDGATDVCKELRAWLLNCDVDCAGVFHILAADGSFLALQVLEVIMTAYNSKEKRSDRISLMCESNAWANRTALEVAIDHGHVTMAIQLLRCGAQYNVKGLLKGKSLADWSLFVDAVSSDRDHSTGSALDQLRERGVLNALPAPLPDTDDCNNSAYADVVKWLKAGHSCSWQELQVLTQSVEAGVSTFATIGEFSDACIQFGCALIQFGNQHVLAGELVPLIDLYFAHIMAHPEMPLHPGVLLLQAHHYLVSSNPKQAYTFMMAYRDGCPRNIPLSELERSLLEICSNGQKKERALLECVLFNRSNDEEYAGGGLGNGGFGRDVGDQTLSASVASLMSSLTDEERQPLNALNNMVGLQNIKEIALKLYKAVHNDKFLAQHGRSSCIVDRTYNFVFAGNPGCGKTVVAKTFAQILQVTGKRAGLYKQFTGSALLKLGAKKFADELRQITGSSSKTGPHVRNMPQDRFLENEQVEVNIEGSYWTAKVTKLPLPKIDKLDEDIYEVTYEDGGKIDKVPFSLLRRAGENKRQGGVIFIDECYDLKPSSSSEGKLIMAEIMHAAEEHRDTLSIILAGHKQDIDNEIFAHNVGMASRFDTVYFNDFNDDELEQIWRMMCKEKNFHCDDETCGIIKRRLIRLRNRDKSFGNARTVRNMFTKIALAAVDRFCAAGDSDGAIEVGVNGDCAIDGSESISITEVDVLGPEPSSNPVLAMALRELDQLVGIPLVKQDIKQTIDVASMNYYRERQGAEPDDVWLNRLFVGNPGTGKTTVAKLYGRILNSLGLLSKDEVMYKTASDFIGQYTGESAIKTNTILKLAEGKVLIIDEAYSLHTAGEFGTQVLDILNEKMAGSAGEDRAIVLIGYEDQLLTMVRDANPGLSRRFDAAHPMRFTDFTSTQLCSIAANLLHKSGVRSTRFSTLVAIVDYVDKQRSLPNFGNAGAMDVFIKSIVKRMRSRKVNGGPASEIIMEDLQDPEDPNSASAGYAANPMSVLDGMQMVGSLKQDMQNLGDAVRVTRLQGKSPASFINNYMFLGNPGTGKTEIAKKMGLLFHAFGLLPTSKVVESSALDLTGEYMGESKSKVEKVVTSALGGILFIDEAYNLGQGTYGRDVQDKLLQMLTEDHVKGKIVVILAGYPGKMEEMCRGNPGFKSRFEKVVHFNDWGQHELTSLITHLAASETPSMSFDDQETAVKVLGEGLMLIKNNDLAGWANARDATSMWGYVKTAQLLRLVESERGTTCKQQQGTRADYNIITVADVRNGVNEFVNARPPVSTPPLPLLAVPGVLEGNPRDKARAATQVQQQQQQQQQQQHQGLELGLELSLQNQERGHVEGNVCACNVFESARVEVLAAVHALEQQSHHGGDAIPAEQQQHAKALKSELSRLMDMSTLQQQQEEEAKALEEEARRLEEAELLSQADEAAMAALQLRQLVQKAAMEERARQLLNEKLRKLGNCVSGFHWIDRGLYWQCAGGAHTVSKKDPGLNESKE